MTTFLDFTTFLSFGEVIFLPCTLPFQEQDGIPNPVKLLLGPNKQPTWTNAAFNLTSHPILVVPSPVLVMYQSCILLQLSMKRWSKSNLNRQTFSSFLDDTFFYLLELLRHHCFDRNLLTIFSQKLIKFKGQNWFSYSL